jgi:hypothetical protein
MQLVKVVLLESWRALLFVAFEVKEALKFRGKVRLIIFVGKFLFFYMIFLIADVFD